MSDIKKGYTFTDKSTDWVSNKETAIRLNKMVDDAKLNLVAGTNITITPTANGPSIAATGGTGTVTSVNLTAGTSISVSGGPITTSGSITVNNTAPDQVVSLTGAGTTTVTGTYPSFTVTSNDAFTGTVTNVSVTTANGVSGTVATPTTTPAITLSLGDISAATSKPSFTNSVTRTFANRAEDLFNVKDYGATGDGFTNDTTAVSNAIAAAVAWLAAMAAADIAASRPYLPRGATVFFPQGTYRILGTQSAVVGTTSDRNIQSLTFLGEGSGVSIILQETSNAGFLDVELANRAGRLNVIGLQVFNTSSTQLSSAAAFKVMVTQESTNDSHPNLFVQDVHVAGISDGSSKSFTYGFDLLNIHMGSFESYMFCGNNAIGGTGARLRKVGTAIPSGSNKCIDISFSKCRFNLANVGVEIKDSTETCLLQQCLIVDCLYGVKADYCIHLGIQNCHINSKVGTNPIGVYATSTSGDVDQAVILGNDIYAELNGATSISGPFTRSVVSGNNFIAGASNTGTKGITTSGSGTVYVGNAFYEYKDYYVTLTGSDNICRENTFTGTTPTNTFVDSGTNNSFEFVCSTTWDPASLVPTQQDFVNISCPGANFGAQCTVGVPYDVQNMFVQATVTSANNVRIAVYNSSGGTVNLGSGTWTVRAKTGPR